MITIDELRSVVKRAERIKYSQGEGFIPPGCAAAAFLGRHVCRPYSTNKSIYLVKFLCFLCIYPFDAV